ncbi:MAG: hypothetical protein K9J37_22200 [Saprospiraceae bacterium]|nr:hypothetical protein [Saprospiraceae bacterium]MCF8252635.1 hypothetical protein [Saprospiraceae bacterium]MCF8314194.1 hypothetical protein [Saprospiraceae bacterium]MCF8442994.1 hypothetical protein [Saprospiraceae bacterium]
MKNLLFTFLSLLSFVSCNNADSKDTSSTTPKEEPTGQKNLCYLRVEGKDTTTVNIILNADGTVSGTYDWTPWGKDGAHGSLKGRKQSDMLTLLYDYTIEGSNQQEEKVMKMTGELMAEAEGELVEGDGGVLKIKEGAKLNWKPLSKVDCK